MRFVEEVVVDEFLPTFRSMLAEALRDRGLTQHEVAEALGVSQSAVSKYVHGEVARREAFTEDERVHETVEGIADGLATGEISQVQALAEAEVLVRRLQQGGPIARIHERQMPELSDYEGTFRIHDPEGPIRTAEQVLASVRRGLRTLEHASGFAALIPAVGSNLCECLPDARTIEDVAGVPGRIVDVKGRPTLAGDPEFGVSEHVARVLLAARAGGADVRGCLNVSYDPDLIDRLAAEGLQSQEFDAEADLEMAVRGAAETDPGARVLYQTGGFGIEPNAYVLGPDAESVARTIRDVV
ncbi:DNA-binding protein [Halobacteriales archaeon QS_1_68_20]|nr:MAG: DNA-binding protein [Halobacteriales archaeon QS_1_68_20]